MNITPLVILIMMDLLKLHTIWNERIERRILHHIQNCNYNVSKTPELYRLKNMISTRHIDYIDSIENESDGINTKSQTLSSIFGGQYSTRSSLYFNSFDAETQRYLEEIAMELKPHMEKLCKKKLELGKSDFRCILLRYEGSNSNFAWHYDTESLSCYRTLALVKKKRHRTSVCVQK